MTRRSSIASKSPVQGLISMLSYRGVGFAFSCASADAGQSIAAKMATTPRTGKKSHLPGVCTSRRTPCDCLHSSYYSVWRHAPAPGPSSRRNRRRNSSRPRGFPTTRSTAPELGLRRLRLLVDDLDEDLVLAHQAELVAGALLDRVGAGLEVLHLGGEAGIAHVQFLVLFLLLRNLVFQFPGAKPAPFAEPERNLDQEDERAEDAGEEFHAHALIFIRACRRPPCRGS